MVCMYLRFHDSLVFFGIVVLKRGRQGGRPQHIGECFKQEDLFRLPGMFCEVPTIAIPLSVVIGQDWKTSSDCTMAVSCFCGSWWLPVVAKWLGWNWSKFLLNNNPQCLFLVGGMTRGCLKKGGGWSV
jgi:hypothetical protein